MTHSGGSLPSAEPGRDGEAGLAGAVVLVAARGRSIPTWDSRPASSDWWMRSRSGSSASGRDLEADPRATWRSWLWTSCHSAHPQVVQVLGLAQRGTGSTPSACCCSPQVAPQVEVGEEVGVRVGEALVLLGAACSLAGRALPRVLDRQGGGDDQHLGDAAVAVGLEHHAAEAGVDRQPGEPPADRREPTGRRSPPPVEGAELLEQGDAVVDAAGVGRVDEREGGDVAEADGRHLEDDRRQVGAQDLGLGELGPGVEVVLGVEADADARARRGRSGRPAGSADAWEIASIGRRCTLVRRL